MKLSRLKIFESRQNRFIETAYVPFTYFQHESEKFPLSHSLPRTLVIIHSAAYRGKSVIVSILYLNQILDKESRIFHRCKNFCWSRTISFQAKSKRKKKFILSEGVLIDCDLFANGMSNTKMPGHMEIKSSERYQESWFKTKTCSDIVGCAFVNRISGWISVTMTVRMHQWYDKSHKTLLQHPTNMKRRKKTHILIYL